MRPTLLYSIIQSFVAFPLTPKHMTLNDLEWTFYVKFSLLRTDVESIIYLFTVESVYMHVTSVDVESEIADRYPQNIWNPRKNCGSFVAATSN